MSGCNKIYLGGLHGVRGVSAFTLGHNVYLQLINGAALIESVLLPNAESVDLADCRPILSETQGLSNTNAEQRLPCKLQFARIIASLFWAPQELNGSSTKGSAPMLRGIAE